MVGQGEGLLPRIPVASAALGLHAPDLTPDDVLARLVDLAAAVGPARLVRYVPPGDHLHGATSVPIALPDEPPVGHLAFDADDRAAPGRIALLASHAAAALAVLARLDEIEQRELGARRTAERLQDALLPDPPDLERTMVACVYRAASRDAHVGGDFYDVFALPDGRALVVVGDIVGKGIEAATRMSRITQTLRCLALTGLGIAELLAVADEQVVFQDSDIMATIWCGLYCPTTGELEFSSLGHPPALLLHEADRTPIRLELQGLPLGMRDLSEEAPEVRSRRLAPGDLLVLYTDGVVETARDFVAGQQALLDAIDRRREEPLVEAAQGALDEMLADAEHLDDALMLLLRRR